MWRDPATERPSLAFVRPSQWGQIKIRAITERGFYLLAPHHYVLGCVLRQLGGSSRNVLGKAIVGLMYLMHAADYVSALLLYVVLARPGLSLGLVFGYGLTTAGHAATMVMFSMQLQV